MKQKKIVVHNKNKLIFLKYSIPKKIHNLKIKKARIEIANINNKF